MSKPKTVFVCRECGAVTPKWLGRCPTCRAWDSLEEEKPPQTPSGAQAKSPELISLVQALTTPEPRATSGLTELDRVLGGGLVQGMVVLVGGEPGIGKSTLMLQLAARLGRSGHKALYVSAEESVRQVGLRARRLGAEALEVMLMAETGLETIKQAVTRDNYTACIVDSIQTVRSSELAGGAGSVGQVRHCASELAALAKETGAAVFLVGHVTKEGSLAGPRLLEHLVDTVLYFESEPSMRLRLLRAVKNRFGATDEVGVFEMTDSGLSTVKNPSAMLLEHRPEGAPGSAVCAAVNGTRPLLVEIQALVSPSGLAMPRRQALGVDQGRLHMLTAVLSIHTGLDLSTSDVFINVAGGVKLTEPASDLAVACAMASSLRNRPLPPDLVCFGEVGLAGELRAVGRTEARLAEASRQGFGRALSAAQSQKKTQKIRLLQAKRLEDALEMVLD
ncbi:DNA repair protein RadA [Dethiosulfatarculus sandiegensis]|uniref:DNA repair protein RadA n=1 Tax=Dethiosulfatarculus sandiegensis TaxID=1429043 RepID=A0A0D2G9V3_9BACT|nr:DNA repair protein RadA [Dethiosulfatarculus sandiegensis]KIX11637.1 DNA repair protein RadA [Dethiosulfatarculus sandiegensis]